MLTPGAPSNEKTHPTPSFISAVSLTPSIDSTIFGAADEKKNIPAARFGLMPATALSCATTNTDTPALTTGSQHPAPVSLRFGSFN